MYITIRVGFFLVAASVGPRRANTAAAAAAREGDDSERLGGEGYGGRKEIPFPIGRLPGTEWGPRCCVVVRAPRRRPNCFPSGEDGG